MLKRRESQSRCSLVWKKTGCYVSSQQFHRLVEPRSPHQYFCCRAVLNSCDTVSRQKDLVDDLLFKSGNRVEFLRLSRSETCQCAKHCTLDFGDFGVLPSVHQCDLDARKLHRPPTASPVELGTGVLWVSTGTHPCGSPSRQDDGETRAPALRTLDDVLRLSRRCGL